jgi:pimeloyl-ACP methyl ester carboxylesterase
MPTLIVWGREDSLTPLASGNMLAQDIVGSQLVVLDHFVHVPQIECGGVFNTTLLKFLAAAPPAQSAQ